MTLLPTPAASVANDGEGADTWLARRERVKAELGNGNGFGMPLGIAVAMLPSPVAQPSGNSPEEHLRKKPGRKVVTDLSIIVENGLLATGGKLLPTPTAERPDARKTEAFSVGRATWHDIIERDTFGQYAPAVARQEAAFGYPAPPPTEPGKTRPRLSARFAEWMMAVPPGWITDVPGVTRNEALRLAGNGVVPPQAAAALRDMLPHALAALNEREEA